jgi:hypothetical protein
VLLDDADEAIRFGIGQRPQHDGVHDREDCRVSADAERQSQHRPDGESRRSAQHAGRVGNVLTRIAQPAEGPRVALKLLRLLHAAELAPRGKSRLVGRHPAPLKFVLENREV